MKKELAEKINEDTKKSTPSELLFKKIMIDLGYRCFDATKDQNMNEHWDVLAVKDTEKGSIYKRIDVKSKKKSHDEGYTWVELQNVKGNTGWLYSEYMDIVAFEKDDCFELVMRDKLAIFINERIKQADIEDENGNIVYQSKTNLGFYRKYRRDGRNDRVVKAPFSDFDNLIYKRIYK